MRKTLDQLMREHPLLQTYLALGGKYHFDSRNIVLSSYGIADETLPLSRNDDEIVVDFWKITDRVYIMEGILESQHEYEEQCRRESDEFEAESFREPERPWQFRLSDNADYS